MIAAILGAALIGAGVGMLALRLIPERKRKPREPAWTCRYCTVGNFSDPDDALTVCISCGAPGPVLLRHPDPDLHDPDPAEMRPRVLPRDGMDDAEWWL